MSAVDRTYDGLTRVQAARIAKRFHEVYETVAPHYGYATRAESAVPWSEVPDTNKRVMVDTVLWLLDEGTIQP